MLPPPCAWQRSRCATAKRPSARTTGGPRTGGDIAVSATARKLATLIYGLLRRGQPYVDEGAEAYEESCRQQRIRSLTAKAKELGYQLTLVAAQINGHWESQGRDVP